MHTLRTYTMGFNVFKRQFKTSKAFRVVHSIGLSFVVLTKSNDIIKTTKDGFCRAAFYCIEWRNLA